MPVLVDTLAWAIRKRILRGKLRKIALRSMSGVAYEICIEGVRLRCYLDDNSVERGIFIRGLDAGNDALRQVFYGLKPGDIFVDIGANAGIFTAMGAKQVGPRGCVIAIEPAPEMVDRLRANVAANGFTNVAVFQMAVGSTPGVETCISIRAAMDSPAWHLAAWVALPSRWRWRRLQTSSRQPAWTGSTI